MRKLPDRTVEVGSKEINSGVTVGRVWAFDPAEGRQGYTIKRIETGISGFDSSTKDSDPRVEVASFCSMETKRLTKLRRGQQSVAKLVFVRRTSENSIICPPKFELTQ